jgi:hypothetical protein
MDKDFCRTYMLSAICVVLLFNSSPLVSQQPTWQDRVLRAAALWQHGVSSIPDDLRSRIANDSAATDLYADLLEGKRTSPWEWHGATILWWLAESSNPKYVPLFLKFSRGNVTDGEFGMAVYGLARHAANGQARARLREIAQASTPRGTLPPREQRDHVANMLLVVNNEAARSALREMDVERLSPAMAARVRRVLAASPRPGRMP